MNLVLIEPSELDAEHRAVLGGTRAGHLITVLRIAVGGSVRVGVIDGGIGTAIATRIEAGRVTLRCSLGEVPARPRIDLLLALPRPKVLGRLYAPLAQLGIGRLILSNAARVERFYFDAHQLDPAFRRAQLLDGLAQARDTRVPVVSVHKSLRVLIEDELDALTPNTRRLLADPGAPLGVRDACAELAPSERILIAIGPEGGWNEFERELLRAHGFTAIGLGPRTLRSDVATIALLAVASDAIASRSA
ncbi:MAG: 16S rRNA (uracil(1498)-N(3))-methyltransferase [Myxococcota bacterium]|nr:16S rRNA (uracil(1498)-N(3))-methyltransferase [Myxococcota bacterium]